MVDRVAERPDLYRVLQVDPSANPLVIQAAYRVLAQIFHPDVSGDEAEMKRLNAAWETLGDPKRRKQYDIERAGRHPGAAERDVSAHARPASSAGRSASTTQSAPRPAAQGAGSASAGSGSASASTSSPPASETSTESQRGSSEHAGTPPGRPFGPVLRFGRYDGWSLGEISGVDRPYLEWLRRAPAGRGLSDSIDAVLLTRNGPGAVDARRHYETNQQQQQVHTWRPGAPTKVG